MDATGIVPEILLQGVRAGLILLGYFLAIPLLLAPLLAHARGARLWRRAGVAWTASC